MSHSILIVDDEADIRKLICGILQDEGYKTRESGSSTAAYASFKEKVPSLVILDIWLEGSPEDGLQILKTIKADYPLVPVIMISGHGNIETAVSAIKDGAYDFIEKPFKSDRLLLMIRRALENAALRRENEKLRQETHTAHEMVGKSQSLAGLKQMLEHVAGTNSRILLTGEPGVGKDLAARYVFQHSERSEKPFIVVNCASLQPDRFEDIMFGQAGTNGLLEQANGGTLFLDEISDLPTETQGKLVRVLQEQKFKRAGATDSMPFDVRVISATSNDPDELLRDGNFREDLYYRLNVVPIHIPALRERKEDIPVLAQYFLDKMLPQTNGLSGTITTDAQIVLKNHSWPGNIRELRNVIEWVLIMHGQRHDGELKSKHLPPGLQGKSLVNAGHGSAYMDIGLKCIEMPLREAREVFERDYLQKQIERFDGHISQMAGFVGMERSALHRKLKSLNISTSGNKPPSDDDVAPDEENKSENRKRA